MENFTGHDRCDATASQSEQALVRFEHVTLGTFQLCKHHADKHREALEGKGFIQTADDTAVLDPANRTNDVSETEAAFA